MDAIDLARLADCHPRIRAVFEFVDSIGIDFRVAEGVRSAADQMEAFRLGRSKVQYPNSLHNVGPEAGRDLSRAIDAYPQPIDWHDRERMTLFAGVVIGVAAAMGIKLRWGGDWDRDWEVRDNRFDDLGHFELMEEES